MMDDLIREWMKHGKTINEILDMPYYFVVELMNEKKKKPQKETSLISAFGG